MKRSSWSGWSSVALVLIASAACSKDETKPAPSGDKASGKTVAPSAGAGTATAAVAPGVEPAAADPDPAAPDPAPADPDPAAADPAPAAADPAAGGPVQVQIGRRFQAGDDNASADPPMFTENGDILMWSRRCGLYADLPTSALYVVCDQDVKSTPIRTAEEVEEVMRLVMEQQSAGHDATVEIMKRYPTGTGGKRDRFDDQGRYQATY